MEDSESQLNSTPNLNASKAPQKVEVVVANPSAESEVNILGELAIFMLRILFSLLKCSILEMFSYQLFIDFKD